MVSDTPKTLLLNEARLVRCQADDLLRRLQNSKRAIEQRCAELGRSDPMTFVTGRSSIDEAIDAAREIIRRSDRLLLAESNGAGRSRKCIARPEPAIAAK